MIDQTPLPPRSQPIDPLAVAASYFSLDCLEFSFHLLREHYPAKALAVQNLLAGARLDHNACSQEKMIELDLDVQLVSDIVSAIADIAESAAGDDTQNKEDMIAIHQTLLDWLLYAQSFLAEADPLTLDN